MGGDEAAAEAMLDVIVKPRSEAAGAKGSPGETILTAAKSDNRCSPQPVNQC